MDNETTIFTPGNKDALVKIFGDAIFWADLQNHPERWTEQERSEFTAYIEAEYRS